MIVALIVMGVVIIVVSIAMSIMAVVPRVAMKVEIYRSHEEVEETIDLMKKYGYVMTQIEPFRYDGAKMTFVKVRKSKYEL